MMTGQFTASREAVVVLEIVGAVPAATPAVVDTGFNGELILARPVIESGVVKRSAGSRHATLADGHQVALDAYLVTILWHGQPRSVLAIQTEDETLVGTALLAGSRLTMEVWDGGTVVIDETT